MAKMNFEKLNKLDKLKAEPMKFSGSLPKPSEPKSMQEKEAAKAANEEFLALFAKLSKKK